MLVISSWKSSNVCASFLPSLTSTTERSSPIIRLIWSRLRLFPIPIKNTLVPDLVRASKSARASWWSFSFLLGKLSPLIATTNWGIPILIPDFLLNTRDLIILMPLEKHRSPVPLLILSIIPLVFEWSPSCNNTILFLLGYGVNPDRTILTRASLPNTDTICLSSSLIDCKLSRLIVLDTSTRKTNSNGPDVP